MSRTATPSSLALVLPESEGPLRHRIAAAIVDALRVGALRPGDALPSSRGLAAELGVSRTAVVDAYDELAAAGFVDSRAGSGTTVAPGADHAARAGAAPHVATGPVHGSTESVDERSPGIDLSPGLPDTDLVSTRPWRSAWRTASVRPIPFAAAGSRGHRAMREALAVHLRRTRGVVADPDEIVIVPGVQAALRTLVGAADLTGRQVAFEDPGYAKARITLAAAGARIRPVPVDIDGLDPHDLRESDAAVYCTPAHQFPMGGRTPVTRRAGLLARVGDRLVIEDDYDGEFRFGVPALPALRSLSGGDERVAYVGTASKILGPGLRLAWLIPPRRLLPRVHDALEVSGEKVCSVTADAFAEFVGSGALTAHLARTSRTYAARRQAFVGALDRHLPGVELLGVEAGLHVALRLPDGCDDRAVAETIEEHGVRVRPLADYRATSDGPRGLLCGYARLPESRADRAAAVIAAAVAAAVGNAGTSTRTGS
jgi:GntR family transcriptional regulator / MocR family aminotransferase